MRNRSKFKYAEIIFLLIVPFALGITGYRLSRQSTGSSVDWSLWNAPESPPFLKFAGMRYVWLTPREAFEGNDTAFEIRVGCEGPPPRDWGEYRIWGAGYDSWMGKDGKMRSEGNANEMVKFGHGLPTFDKEDQTYAIRFVANLRKAPGHGELRYKVTLSDQDPKTLKTKAELAVSMVLRARGKTTPKPVISKYCPLSLVAYRTRTYASGSVKRFQIYLDISNKDSAIDASQAQPNFLNPVILKDEQGRSHRFKPGIDFGLRKHEYNEDKKIYSIWVDFALPAMPPAKRFEANLAIGNYWPLAVDVDLTKNVIR